MCECITFHEMNSDVQFPASIVVRIMAALRESMDADVSSEAENREGVDERRAFAQRHIDAVTLRLSAPRTSVHSDPALHRCRAIGVMFDAMKESHRVMCERVQLVADQTHATHLQSTQLALSALAAHHAASVPPSRIIHTESTAC